MLYNKQALCARYLHLLLYDEKINKKPAAFLNSSFRKTTGVINHYFS
jgi:hypothetical protein